MSLDEALAEVRKDLSSAFGEALADKILASAQSAAQMPSKGFDAAQFTLLLETLGKDDRVIGMLGELGVKDRMKRWKKLL
jgi:hypothetical protein